MAVKNDQPVRDRLTIMVEANLADWARRAARVNELTLSELVSEAIDEKRRRTIIANQERGTGK